jgi:uncharacterized damage-inducible protein DinB
MKGLRDLGDTVLAPWRTNNQVTVFLIDHIPDSIWTATVPGVSRKTIAMISGHMHNMRCMWLETLGQPHGIAVPARVDRGRVGRRQLVVAFNRSSQAMEALLRLGCRHGGEIPATPKYVWRNLSLDVGHVLTYFVAHEAHHRGQIVLAARQLGTRLPSDVTAGLWRWKQPPR